MKYRVDITLRHAWDYKFTEGLLKTGHVCYMKQSMLFSKSNTNTEARTILNRNLWVHVQLFSLKRMK